jgi:AraC-like DNA-binding protein
MADTMDASETGRPAARLTRPLVSARQAQTKLLALQRVGIGVRQVAKLAGIDPRTARRVRAGHVSTISQGVATAILGIQQPYLAHGQKISAGHCKRLLRALKDEAYTKAEIARQAGLRPEQLSRHFRRVTVATHLKILRLWQRVTRADRGGVVRL